LSRFQISALAPNRLNASAFAACRFASPCDGDHLHAEAVARSAAQSERFPWNGRDRSTFVRSAVGNHFKHPRARDALGGNLFRTPRRKPPARKLLSGGCPRVSRSVRRRSLRGMTENRVSMGTNAMVWAQCVGVRSFSKSPPRPPRLSVRMNSLGRRGHQGVGAVGCVRREGLCRALQRPKCASLRCVKPDDSKAVAPLAVPLSL
jgi:hypothetical protein